MMDISQTVVTKLKNDISQISELLEGVVTVELKEIDTEQELM
jgi:hypothetical protein